MDYGVPVVTIPPVIVQNAPVVVLTCLVDQNGQPLYINDAFGALRRLCVPFNVENQEPFRKR